MALSGTVTASLSLSKTSPRDLTTPRSAIEIATSLAFVDGTGAGAFDREFDDSRSLAASAGESLDLAGSALVDEFGTAMGFARVKLLYVKNTSAVASIGVGDNVANYWSTGLTDRVIIPPGGILLIVAPNAAGWAVTAGTGDLLRVDNLDGSNAATYDIIIAGASA